MTRHFWDDYWFNRRTLLIQLLLLIPATILGLRIFLPDIFGSEFTRLIPSPIDTILEVVTILLIISPLLDWFNKPRIRIYATPQGNPRETRIQIVNIGNRIGEQATIRVGVGNFFETDEEWEILSGGSLRPTPRRMGPFSGFDITVSVASNSDDP